MNTYLHRQFHKVEKFAKASRIYRVLHNPLKYLRAIGYRKFVYPRTGREWITSSQLFYGQEMIVALPSATDIYPASGKSHDSEIRLTRFMINSLEAGNQVLDIGAHYGFFTLLSSRLVGERGKVFSFEPSASSFSILNRNSRSSNISIFREAVAERNGRLQFHEFPNLYSEYNAIDIAQFEQRTWFDRAAIKSYDVPVNTIDSITGGGQFRPHFIKIDVEGAEDRVIEGGRAYLQNSSPVIAMEFLEEKRQNAAHRKAAEILAQMGYKPHRISRSGTLDPIGDIDAHLFFTGLESDNIIFARA